MIRLLRPAWLLSIIPLVMIGAKFTHACTCIQQSVSERLDQAFVVFSGTVSIHGEFSATTFQVKEWFKGDLGDEITVLVDASTCGLSAEPGFEFLIYAREPAENEVWPSTGLCVGSRPILEALNSLLFLSQTGRGEPDYRVAVLLFAEMTQGDDLEESDLEVSLLFLLNSNLSLDEPLIDASQIIVHYVSSGATFAVVQIFDATDGDSAPSSARIASLLQELVDEDLAQVEGTFAELGLGSLTKLIFDAVQTPHDIHGDPVPGWFTREGSKVDFDDFFALADAFGAKQGDPDFHAAFDISGPAGEPDGFINYDDFFRFADDFGKTIFYPGFVD